MFKSISKQYCLIIPLLLVGCSDDPPVPSDTIATGNIYANMNITHTQDGNAVIEVQMRKGAIDGEHVRLTGDDRLITATREIINTPTPGRLFDDLVATTEGTQLLKEGSKRIDTIWGDISIGGPWYVAEFDNLVGIETFYLSLEREFDQDAINSNVNLPPPLSISYPESTTTEILRSANITIIWGTAVTSPAYTMTVSADAVCETGETESWFADVITDDPGTVVIPAGSFTPLTASGTCSIKILVERSKLGTINNNLLGGSIIRAHNQASVTIQTTN